MKTLTRLQPGMVIRHMRRLFKVRLVNESRAAIVPIEKTTVELRPTTRRNAGKTITFEQEGRELSISPNAECEIVSWPKPKEAA